MNPGTPGVPPPPASPDAAESGPLPAWALWSLAGTLGAVLVVGGYVLVTATEEPEPSVVPIDDLPVTDVAAEEEDHVAREAADTATCTLPVSENLAHAYTYGLPPGWDVEEAGDLLMLRQDEHGTTAVLIYTARLDHDPTARELLDEFIDVFHTVATADGDRFSSSVVYEGTDLVAAAVVADGADGELVGTFEVGKDAGFLTFAAYWAPAADYPELEPTLTEIVDCFERTTELTDAHLAAAAAAAAQPPVADHEPAPASAWGPLVSRAAGDFEFSAPESWNAQPVYSGGESPANSLKLLAPTDDAAVTFAHNLGRYGVIDPRDLAARMMLAEGIQAPLHGHTLLEDGVDAYEFAGNLVDGRAVKGVVAVHIESYQTYFSNLIGIQLARADLWDAYAPTLNAIQSSIRFTDASGVLASLPAMPDYSTEAVFGEWAGGDASFGSGFTYQQEIQDRAADNWAAAMRGYETFESPSTGEQYEVPLNAWDARGPDGPGPYRALPGGGRERLVRPDS